MKTRLGKYGMALAVWCVAAGSWAATPAELQALLAEGETLTLIDVRERSLYQAGHIANAINVPLRVVGSKKLPPLGRVVVYDRGLGGNDAATAVRMLNEKAGIQAEVLEGGYAAWEANRGSTTRAAGFHREQLNYISYQDLSGFGEGDVVLVDLRTPNVEAGGRLTRQGTTAAAAPLSVLEDKFPGKAVVKSPFDIPAVAARAGGENSLKRMSEAEPVPVMVLIDNGDGEAEKTARILRANGIRRVVILAGGERIVERDGAPGLQRMGMGTQTVEGDDE
ncbi:rhodanese-like domain-containing protein [Pontiella sp.]|uniref:rhodanese-like domain-containing protein n=1 Tax=Pontiella sp. TaxID=2837462 RepID=UPI0035682484